MIRLSEEGVGRGDEAAARPVAQGSQRGSEPSPAVEIEVEDASRGGELVECLWRHGLPARLVERAARWRVEVRSPREEPASLRAQVRAALDSWSHGERASVAEERDASLLHEPEEAGSELSASLFRAVNERIRELEESQWHAGEHDFVCECDDAACTSVLRMTAEQYDELRANPGWFAVLPGHVEPETDEVIRRSDRFVIVSERLQPERR